MSEEDRWAKLEEIVRRVIREEIALLGRKAKLELVNGRWVGITEQMKESWKAAYGAVDLEAELKRAAAWVVSNPMRAPKSQMGRFLNTWMTQEQNRASIRSIPTVRSIAEKKCAYCERPASGSVNGFNHCSACAQKAMDGESPFKMRQA